MQAKFLSFIRLSTILCVSAWLAACSTTPGSPEKVAMPPPSPAPIASPPAVPPPPAYGDTKGGPGDAVDLPVSPLFSIIPSVPSAARVAPGNEARDEAEPSSLAGESLKEFQRGHASWYGPGFHGRRTASGERFDMQDLTAAHRTLPFGTVVRVHSLVNGRDVDVRITDRGPYSGNRIIDLSRAAAEELGMLGMGFKEVVLLVPDSLSTEAILNVLPTEKKRPRPIARRAPQPRAR